ncbi:hypothetical protein LDL59_14480 [Kaistella anthropi]|nr:hypothetical protein [Kaistella anthropi]
MKNDLLISPSILYWLVFFGIIFTVFSVSFDLSSFGISVHMGKILSYVAVLCNFIVAIVLIIDVFKNHNPSRFLWTLGFLLFGAFVGYFYLRNRDSYSAQP